ncbi:Thermophilic serine proteinase [Candidatus Brocadiaceae bacterium]|nr:Thermophilic serine proteinase [Candidatus Brocadiaceae bacterium]
MHFHNRFIYALLFVAAQSTLKTADAETAITIKVSPSVQESTLELIATATEPEEVYINNILDFESELKNRYGAAAQRMLKFIGEPDFSSGALVVRFPGGPAWTEEGGSTAIIPKGSNVWTVATRELGSYENHKKELENLNEKNLANVSSSFSLKLPPRPISVSLTLLPKYSSDDELDKLIENLEKDKSVLAAHRTTSGQFIGGLATTDSRNDCDASSPLPYDEKDFAEIIRRYTKEGRWQSKLPVIAILDSGIHPSDNRLARAFNEGELPENNGIDEDKNKLVDDWAGYDFATKSGGFPDAATAPDEDRDHGSNVAGIASGAILPDEIKNYLQGSAKILMLKILHKDIDDGGIADAWIGEAISYAGRKGIQIANLSFEMVNPSNTLGDALRKTDMLIIAAAGNGSQISGKGLDIDVNERFPASWGGPKQDNVITVSASSFPGKLTTFSNFAINAVDISTSGCKIDSFAYKEGKSVLSGTSQAAPWVALTAELLIATGMNLKQIKPRILSAGDANRYLEDKIWSSSSLNIAKAIARYDDIVQTKNKTIYGNLTSPNRIKVCGFTKYLRDYRKIVPEFRDGNGLVMYESSSGSLEKKVCTLSLNGAVTITPRDGSESITINDSNEILEIIPKFIQ